MLLRMLTLLASLIGYVDKTLTAGAAVAIIFLTAASMLGLSVQSVPQLLERHPILVVLDGLGITVVMVALGTDNPLVLVALSSCIVIGVVLPAWPAALCTIVLVSGYLTGSLTNEAAGDDFISRFGLPITFVWVVALGQAFRVIAERKRQSERAFADLVSGAAAAEERARLARELHDSTTKTLQGVALSARSLGHWIERDATRARREADDIVVTIDEEIGRLRQLLSALRHDDLGQPFHESLGTLARDLAQAQGVRVALALDPVIVSAPGVRFELLAAAREAITNAAVHSGADKVHVSLVAQRDDLVISVRDDGSGFSLGILPERERAGHFGVRGYSERLALVGGRADVTSAPGRGTHVELVAPMRGLREEDRD